MATELFADEQEAIFTDREAKAWLRKLDFNDEFIDQKDWRFVSPLHEASAAGHINMVKWLVERGANVSSEDMVNVSQNFLEIFSSNYFLFALATAFSVQEHSVASCGSVRAHRSIGISDRAWGKH